MSGPAADRGTHIPVLFDEVMQLLNPQAGGTYVDCTINGGGHAAGLLERSAPTGRLLGLDADPAALELARQRLAPFAGRFTLVHANFRKVASVAPAQGFREVQGVLFDLGVSWATLAESGRGFSFQRPAEPLDMRFDPTGGLTAADILNRAPEAELVRIFREYGEEHRGARLARAIVRRRAQRPFRTVGDLLEVVDEALGPRRGRLHPATKVFQALRVATNDELGALSEGLAGAVALLAPGGRLAVISFHSLEDRLAKRFLLEHAAPGALPAVQILTRKPITPRREEMLRNPRARSAKLRAAARV